MTTDERFEKIAEHQEKTQILLAQVVDSIHAIQCHRCATLVAQIAVAD
jgi:hypothetical protein